MAEGNRLVVQDDFSAGAFPHASFVQIPGNGVYDAVNLLVDDDRALAIRGGSRWAAPAFGGSSLWWSWSGVIGSTRRTIVASGSGLAAVDDFSGTTTPIAMPPPAHGPGVTLAGLLFMPDGVTINGALGVGAAALTRNYYAVAGNRLWAAALFTTRVDFTDVGAPGTFSGFHEIPDGIIGLAGLRDAVVVFTVGGVWVISNVGMNLTDAAGNVQHRIDRYSQAVVLWHVHGLGASFEGAMVVPAVDGVYLMSYGVTSEAPQGFTLISRPIAGLYRSYVTAGYIPGQPVIYRNYLLLPILNGNGRATALPVDMLICKLDATDAQGNRTYPWMRVSSLATGPLTLTNSIFGHLLGGSAAAARPMLIDYFDPSLSMTDADGQGWTTSMKTRAPVSPDDMATLVKVRLGYQQTGGAGTSANYVNELGGSTALSGTAGDNSGTKRAPFSWRVAKPARYSTVEVAQAGAPSVFRVKSFEWFIRQHGRV